MADDDLHTEWDVEKVSAWLTEVGLDDVVAIFQEQEITGQALGALDHDLLKEMGIPVIGTRLKILQEIQRLQENDGVAMGLRPQASDPNLGGFESDGNESLNEVDMTGEAVMKGWLSKQSGSVVKRWRRRFFVLRDNCLFYAKTAKATQPIGCIPLEGYGIKRKRDVMTLTKHDDRTYTLKAPSEQAMSQWCSAITREQKGGRMRARSGTSTRAAVPRAVLRMKSQSKLPQDCGKFLRQGLLKKSPASGKGKHHMRHFFLFDNYLIYTVASGSHDYKIKGIIELNNADISDTPDEGDVVNAFSVACSQGTYVIQAKSQEEKYSWMTAVAEVIFASRALSVNGGLGGSGGGGGGGGGGTSSRGGSRRLRNSPIPAADPPAATATPAGGATGGASTSAADEPQPVTAVTAVAAVEPVPAVPVSGGVATVTTVQKTQTVLSKISLDKNFGKPFMPNCVRVASYNVTHPEVAGDELTAWSQRKLLIAKALRSHACDVIGVQGIAREELGDLLEDMRDYTFIDGVSEKEEGVPLQGVGTPPFSPLLYFRWRCQLKDSGLIQPPPVDGVTAGEMPWLMWAEFNDVFTELDFFHFNLDLTASAAAAPASLDELISVVQSQMASIAGEAPFALSVSGVIGGRSTGRKTFGADVTLPNGKETSLVDAMIENIPPGHMHTGPKTTFEALEEGAEGEKRDFVFHKRGHVETLQSAVTLDCFETGHRGSLHRLVIADIIIDGDFDA